MMNLIPLFITEKAGAGKKTGTIKAAAVFVDAKGFTSLTDELSHLGKAGAEKMAEAINKIFSPAVQSVHGYGGFITNFAGDAFCAVFENASEDPQGVLSACWRIRNHFKGLKLEGMHSIKSKIGISYGKIEWKILGDEENKLYYFRGEAIEGCSKSEKKCGEEEIVFDKNFLSIIKEKLGQEYYKMPEEGKYVLKKKVEKNFYIFRHGFSNLTFQKNFYPELLFSRKEAGEFRDVVSCFIKIHDKDNTDIISLEILNKTKKYGGYFNRLTFGDKGVFALVLFGAPVSSEDTARRACTFICDLKASHGSALSAGITYGKAFCGFVGSKERAEYTAQGTKVNLAARLMGLTTAGQILSDDIFYDETEDGFLFKYEGKHKLKGFTEDKKAYSIEKTAKKLFTDRKLDFVGRKNEKEELIKFFDDENKLYPVALITGAAGIGKSELLKNSLSHAERFGKKTFILTCDSFEKKPFQLIGTFLSSLFMREINAIDKRFFEEKINSLTREKRKKPSSDQIQRMKYFVGTIIGLEYKSSDLASLSPKEKHARRSESIIDFFKFFIGSEKAVFAVENAHYLDEESGNILISLVKALPDSVQIVFICRIEKENEDNSKDRILILTEGIKKVTIRLKPFDRKTSDDYIRSLLDSLKVHSKTLEFIYEKCEGNPFYTAQIIAFLRDNSFFGKNYAIIKKLTDIPADLNNAIIARVDRLEENKREICKYASVLGDSFPLSVVSMMMRSSSVQKETDDLIKEGLMKKISAAKMSFDQGLIRDAVYGMLLTQRLSDLHGKAGLALEKYYGEDREKHLFELADHFIRSENKEKALIYSEKAGEEAAKNYLTKNALYYFDCAEKKYKAGLNERGSEYAVKVCRTLLSKAAVIYNTGDLLGQIPVLKEALEIAEKYGDADLIFKCRQKRFNVFLIMGDYNNAQNELKELGKIVKKTEKNEHKFFYYNGEAMYFTKKGNYKKALIFSESSQKIIQRDTDRMKKGQVFSTKGSIYEGLNELHKALKYYEKAAAAMASVKDKRAFSILSNNMANIYFYFGENQKALSKYKKIYEFRKKIGDKNGMSVAQSNFATVYKKLRQYSRAKKWLLKSIKISDETGNLYQRALAYGHLEELSRETGRLDEAREYLSKAMDYFMSTGNEEMIVYCHIAKGLNYLEAKDLENSLKTFDYAEKKSKSSSLLAIISLKKAKIELLMGNRKKAIEHLRAAKMYEKKSLRGDLREEVKELENEIYGKRKKLGK